MRPQVWMRESLMSFQAWMREALMSFQAWMREALMIMQVQTENTCFRKE